jgi:hypothetical protein
VRGDLAAGTVMRIGEIDRLRTLCGITVRGDGKIETILLERRNLSVEGNHAPFELETELLGDRLGQFHFKTGELGAIIVVERLETPFSGATRVPELLIASHSRACDGLLIKSERE